MEVTTGPYILVDSLVPLTLTTGDYDLIIDLGIEHLLSLHAFRNGYMLWTDTSADRVYRAFLNGSSVTTYIGPGIMSCAGMCVCLA